MTAITLVYLIAKYPSIRSELNPTPINRSIGINRTKLCVLMELGVVLVIICLIFSNTFRSFILSTQQIIKGDDNHQLLWALNYQMVLVCVMLAHVIVA